MMSKKNGPVYGFQLKSLASLKITKSSNKKRHLLHYISDLVHEKYPELQNFHTELKCVDKVVQYVLETVESEVVELEKGMGKTKGQMDHVAASLASATDPNRKIEATNLTEKQAQSERLQAFYERCKETVTKIREDFDKGKGQYKDCYEFYGEKTDPGLKTFFGYFVDFVKDWKQAQIDAEKLRKRLAAEALKKASGAAVGEPSGGVERKNKVSPIKSLFKY